MVTTNLKKSLLLTALFLGPVKPSIHYSGRINIPLNSVIDSLYKNITLPDNGTEFILCTNKNKYYFPEQKADQENVSYDLCKSPYNGTIHSHPTHLDEYLCEPSKFDSEEFLNSTDIYMGIACYDNKTKMVYVNGYSR